MHQYLGALLWCIITVMRYCYDESKLWCIKSVMCQSDLWYVKLYWCDALYDALRCSVMNEWCIICVEMNGWHISDVMFCDWWTNICVVIKWMNEWMIEWMVNDEWMGICAVQNDHVQLSCCILYLSSFVMCLFSVFFGPFYLTMNAIHPRTSVWDSTPNLTFNTQKSST